MANRFSKRHHNITNTAEEGDLCIYSGHSMGRFSSHSMRYESHNACVRCVAAAREGRVSFDIDALLKTHRQKALQFWSMVDIGELHECWDWKGCINKRTTMPQFSWRRSGISSSTQQHPQRVAMWLTWGDLGITQVKPICGNRYCCNPFHLIPQKIGVFVDSDSYIENFDIQCQVHTLKQRVQEYRIEQAIKEQELDQTAEIEARDAMLLDPDIGYADRFEAAIQDLLLGRHISQTELDSPGLNRLSTEDDEDPTPES